MKMITFLVMSTVDKKYWMLDLGRKSFPFQVDGLKFAIWKRLIPKHSDMRIVGIRFGCMCMDSSHLFVVMMRMMMMMLMMMLVLGMNSLQVLVAGFSGRSLL